MSKKILLASGCSFTDPSLISWDTNIPDNERGGWSMWPEVVAKNLNMNLINIGKSGRDNSTIINKAIKAAIENDGNVKAIMILLSGWDRFPIFNSESVILLASITHILSNTNKLNEFMLDSSYFFKNKNIRKGIMEMIYDDKDFFYNVYKNSIEQTFISIYNLIQYCENKNINYIIGQGVPPFNIKGMYYYDYSKKLEYHTKPDMKSLLKILSSSLGDELEKKADKFIGWPFAYELGGWSFDDLRYGKLRNSSKFKGIKKGISSIDTHPNEKEQEIIADYFLEKYKELYS